MSNESRAKFEAENSTLTIAFKYDEIGDRYLRRHDGFVTPDSVEFTAKWKGWQARQSEIDSLRAENERLIESLSRIRFYAARSSMELFSDIREWESTPIEDDD